MRKRTSLDKRRLLFTFHPWFPPCLTQPCGPKRTHRWEGANAAQLLIRVMWTTNKLKAQLTLSWQIPKSFSFWLFTVKLCRVAYETAFCMFFFKILCTRFSAAINWHIYTELNGATPIYKNSYFLLISVGLFQVGWIPHRSLMHHPLLGARSVLHICTTISSDLPLRSEAVHAPGYVCKILFILKSFHCHALGKSCRVLAEASYFRFQCNSLFNHYTNHP